MATGRTVQKWYRMYVDGFDVSGFARTIAPLGVEYDEADMTVWTDLVKGYLRNQANCTLGEFNGVFDNTAITGLHAVLGTAGGKRNCLVAIGIQGIPAQSDPVFMGQFNQGSYLANNEGGAVTAQAKFENWSGEAVSLAYIPGWGQLLHPNQAETAVNTAIGFDNYTGLQTVNGGLFMYHVLAGNGTATIKAQDAATNTNPSFADLSGATSGVIDCTTRQSGMVALPVGATVRQFLRWQIVLGTATTVTFVSAFMRHYP